MSTEVSTTSIEVSPQDTKIISKWLFILVGLDDGSEIRGNIRLTKTLFLIAKTLSKELDEAIYFYPYQFGPYSSRLGHLMNKYIDTEEIIVEYKNQDWGYTLSETSMKLANKYISDLDEELIEKLLFLKKRLKRKSVKAILKEIYTEYPEYAEYSSIADEIKYSAEIDLDKKDSVDDGSDFVAFSTETNIELTAEEAKALNEDFELN